MRPPAWDLQFLLFLIPSPYSVFHRRSWPLRFKEERGLAAVRKQAFKKNRNLAFKNSRFALRIGLLLVAVLAIADERRIRAFQFRLPARPCGAIVSQVVKADAIVFPEMMF